MNPMRLLPGMTATEDQTSLIADLRSGRAGIGIRLGLSLAAAPILVAPFMFLYALIEMGNGTVRDEHLALAFGIAGAVWCGCLTFIWAGYRRFARVLKTMFAIVGVWVITIPLCVFVDSRVRSGEEYLIAGLIMTASALTVFFVTTCVYRSLGGKRIANVQGEIAVNCPTCGYSLVGLDACRCPECGANSTIDELIGAQDYEALRPKIAIREILPDVLVRGRGVEVDEARRIAGPGDGVELPPEGVVEPT